MTRYKKYIVLHKDSRLFEKQDKCRYTNDKLCFLNVRNYIDVFLSMDIDPIAVIQVLHTEMDCALIYPEEIFT